MLTLAAVAVLLALSSHRADVDGELRFARFDRCALESGAVILDCRIGYRTFGRLNADRTNAVLVPTGFTGTSAALGSLVGRGKLLDHSIHYIIAVDALGNGVSSSPSNSGTHPGDRFPDITVRDMVATQHRLATEVLGLRSLHAVVGSSMGGMQAFQWLVSHPAFVQRAVAIHGSPQLASYDLLLWETMLRATETAQGCASCDPLAVYAPLASLVLETPQRFAWQVSRDELPAFVRDTANALRDHHRPEDVKRQLRAMLRHDVAAEFAGSMQRAADRIGAGRMLIVVATQDHVVRPEPSVAFARLAQAELLELTGDCGHRAAQCEAATVVPRVTAFLARPR